MLEYHHQHSLPKNISGKKTSLSICLLLGRIRAAGDDWRMVDGVAGGVAGDHQHQLPCRPRLLLLRPTHHQEEPRH